MNEAGLGRENTNRWEVSLLTVALLALAGLPVPAIAASDATLQATGDVLVAEARTDHQPPRLQVQASTLPRMEANDNGFQAPRVDVSLFPSGGPSGIGPVVGISTPRPGVAAYGLNPQSSSVDLGVRWTQRLSNHQQIDVTAWRRMITDQDAYSLIQRQQQPMYGARVELNLAASSSKTRLAADLGFIGLQLEGGARISIKRKYGGPMVYYRTSF